MRMSEGQKVVLEEKNENIVQWLVMAQGADGTLWQGPWLSQNIRDHQSKVCAGQIKARKSSVQKEESCPRWLRMHRGRYDKWLFLSYCNKFLFIQCFWACIFHPTHRSIQGATLALLLPMLHLFSRQKKSLRHSFTPSTSTKFKQIYILLSTESDIYIVISQNVLNSCGVICRQLLVARLGREGAGSVAV